MAKLNKEQELFHKRVLKYGKVHTRSEQGLVENLIGVETSKAHKALDKSSMFKYAMDYLDVSKPTAYGLITVARKAQEIPELRKAISERKLSVAKVTRFVAHVDKSNASEMIEFAISHTFDEIDYEVARRNPNASKPDKVKILAEDRYEITITANKQTLAELKRIQSLLLRVGRIIPTIW